MSDPQADVALLDSPPALRLDGRVAWVTGASRGLGRSLAYGLAGAGAEVMLSARSEEPLQAIVADIRAHGGSAEIAVGSVADPDSIAQVITGIEQRWGRLDVLINNAGISSAFRPAEKIDDDDWHEVLEVNLFGAFACCRAALPLLEGADAASIINVSSVHATSAHERLVAYAASKGGLEMLTRTLAVEWAPRGIRVNSVAPGYLETDMTAGLLAHPKWNSSLLDRIPMGRFGSTQEVVSAVLFLAARTSSYVTGTTLHVDGGWTAR